MTAPLATSDSGPVTAPEKFAASRVKVAAAPLSAIAPAPRRFVSPRSKPPRSKVAPASTVVGSALAMSVSARAALAALSVPATTLKVNGMPTSELRGFQMITPSCPSAPKLSVEFEPMPKTPVSLSVVPCAAAIVDVPENMSVLLRVSFAAPSSSPPLIETMPAPTAAPLPKARTPPDRETLPIVFASLRETKPESTVSAPSIVSEPVFSISAA